MAAAKTPRQAPDPGPDEATQSPDEQPQPEASEPFSYIAAEDLFIYDPESGAMPARAYSAGSLVPPADVARFGWADQVRNPEE